MPRSFDSINYSTRPNKAVERKLIVEAMAELSTQFPIADYRYIGFGSVWFSDFVLLHRLLHISDMISIEIDASRESRVEFNRPFQCVDVKIGSASLVLPNLTWDKKTLCWLDYDGALEEEVLEDIRRVIDRAPSGSVLIVSVNADARTLEADARRTPEDRYDALKRIAGGAVPHEVTAVTPNNASEVIGQVLLNAMLHAMRVSGRTMHFEPLLNLAYSDGVPMVSCGGIMLDEDDAVRFAKTGVSKLQYVSAPKQFEIDVPHLTPREKLMIDQLLPKKKLTAKDLGFTIPDKKMRSYKDLYRFYPLYSEVLF